MRYDATISGELHQPMKKVLGIQKLVNLVEKLLLTTYGSDTRNPTTGCYIKRMIGSSYSSIEELAAEINQEVKRVEEQIKRIQRDEMRKGVTIDPRERLQSLNLVNVQELPGGELWSVQATYEVVNREGERESGEVF